MFQSRPLIQVTLPIAVTLLLLTSIFFLLQSSFFQENSEALSLGLSVDLLIVIPSVYLLMIWRSSIPKTTVLPIIIIGLIIGYRFIPEENHTYFNLFKTWVIPAIELSILTFLFFKLRRTILTFNEVGKESIDVFEGIKKTCIETFPKPISNLIAAEASIFYCVFISWKNRKLENKEFSYHKENGTIALLLVLLFVIAIETVALHLLLMSWNELVAWILTGLSMYAGLQIIGILKSIAKRPIRIGDDSLYLRYGIMKETTIPFSNIQLIEPFQRSFQKEDGIVRLSPLGELESHNLLITLKNEQQLMSLYGFKGGYRKIAFHIDDKEGFEKVMEESLLTIE